LRQPVGLLRRRRLEVDRRRARSLRLRRLLRACGGISSRRHRAQPARGARVITAILRKEILGSGRHGRYFAVRGAYLLLLSCVTIPAIYSQAKTMLETPTFNASSFGRDFTITFGILQFVLVVLLAPA